MNELRWILLIAGAVLLLAVYLWGLRGRGRGAVPAREQDWSTPEAASDAADAVPEPAWEPPVEHALRRSTVTRDPPLVMTPANPVRTGRAAAQRREPTLGDAPPLDEDDDLPSISASRPARGEAATVTAAAAENGLETEPRIGPPPAVRTQKIVTVRVTAPAPSSIDGLALREAVEGLGLVHGRYSIYHRLDAQGRPVFSMASLLEPGTFDPATMAGASYPGVALFAVLPGPVSGHHALDDLMATARSLADRLGGNLLDERGAMLSVQRMTQIREEVTVFERSLHAARGH